MTITETKTQLLTRAEVEARIGLSTTSLYRLMRAGRLPEPLQIGPRLVRWREDEIEKWIATRGRAAGTLAVDASRPMVGQA